MSAVGAFIKVPSPTGTVALDSWPGYLCAVLVDYQAGGLVAFLGHLASAFTAGFPLGLPMHSAVALEMSLCAWTFGWVAKKLGLVPAMIVAIILNGVAAPAAMIPWLGTGFFAAMLVPLTGASAINVVVAVLVFKAGPFGRSRS